MTDLLPGRFLFRFSIDAPFVAELPRSGPALLDLPETGRLPDFGELEAANPFADLRVAWNAGGFGISAHVTGKRQPVECDAEQPDQSDGLSVWIDTRNTQSIHRASRFCHRFQFLPAGDGRHDKDPLALQLRIPQAREDAPLAKRADLHVVSRLEPGGYCLEVWLPAAALHGFDPEASPRLGFYYHLRDAELGEQFLTVGREFPFTHDPSLWSTLELVRR